MPRSAVKKDNQTGTGLGNIAGITRYFGKKISESNSDDDIVIADPLHWAQESCVRYVCTCKA